MIMEEDEDRAVFFGTEFDELDNQKDGISKKPLNVQDQVVTDEKGRRRFHGAFTGGFSAGYFNTAGTKEGWAPSSFKSSRDGRASGKLQQTAEDFMDDEDLGEFGIAPRTMRAKREFVGKKPEESSSSSLPKQPEPIPGFSDIIKPVESTFGIQLLLKMGWRQGKGIGPRAKMKKKAPSEDEEEEEAKTYGCQLGPGISLPSPTGTDSESEDEPEMRVLPEDVEPEIFQAKKDVHGLGYRALDPGNPLGSINRSHNSVAGNKKRMKGLTGQAFGVGVFEEDDEDVYTAEDISQYDFSLGGTGSSTGKQGTLSSGTVFVEAANSQSSRKFFAPPKLPRDFVPEHKVATFDPSDELTKTLDLVKEKLNPILRSRILGEKSHSIKSLMKEKDKERLEAAVKNTKPEKEVKIEPKQTTRHPDDNLSMEELARKTYPKELEKRQRFIGYLNCLQRGFAVPQPPTMTEWEWEAETREFKLHLPPSLHAKLQTVSERQRPLAKAEISAPFAHLLKSKFTSASGTDDDSNKEGEDADKVQAVRMKMFGKLTREQHEWHPGRVLCKSFNLPDPYPTSYTTGVLSLKRHTDRSREVMGHHSLPSTAQELRNRADMREREDSDIKKEPNEEEEESEIIQDEEEEDDAERPPADLFKAIFLESDIDSDSDDSESQASTKRTDDSEKEKRAQPFKTRWAPPVPQPAPLQPVASTSTPAPAISQVKTEEPDIEIISSNAYGPPLPPPMEDDCGPKLPTGTSSIQRERDRRSPKKHKSKKKKHKHSKKSSHRKHRD